MSDIRARERFPRAAVPGVLVILLALQGALAQASQSAPELPLLTRVEQIQKLTPDEAARGYPVRLRGSVTSGGTTFFFHDGTAGIFVETAPSKTAAVAGDLIVLDGVTSRGQFARNVKPARWRVLRKDVWPKPKRPGFSQMASGAEAAEWVETDGIVREAVNFNQGTNLLIDSAHGRFRALVYGLPAPEANRLVDAEVRLRGVCNSQFNPRRQFIGFRLRVPTPKHVFVIAPAPSDPYAAPVTPVDHLLLFAPGGVTRHRVRVRGVVALYRPDGQLFLLDGGAGLSVQMRQAASFKPGDVVEALGFAAMGGYSTVLEHAECRLVSAGKPPAPVAVTPDQALKGGRDSELVRLEAAVVEWVRSAGEEVLVLKSGQTFFEAALPLEKGAARLAAFRPGSQLRLTGVCVNQIDENRVPRAFRVLLRSAEDIEVLRRPFWWTIERTLEALGVVTLAALAALGWVVSLRKRLRRQMRMIRQTIEKDAALEQRFRELVENATDVVLTCDLEGNVTSINRAGETLLGYSRQQTLALNLADLTAPEQRALTAIWIREVVERGHITGYETEFLTRDGQRLTMDINASLIRRDDEPVGVQSICREITERKRVAAELQKAKEAAEAASQAKSEFLANMSHEIRTPMNGVIGMTELALGTELTAEQREYVVAAKTSAENLTLVINDILDFSKIEAGRLQLAAERFHLRDILGGTVHTVAWKAYQKGLELACRVAPEVPDALVGDVGRLRQVLLNLLGNAIKFTERGEVVLDIQCAPAEPRSEDCLLQFSVRDTGIGIPACKQEDVFQAFVQADGSTARQYGGTGLGLSISSQLVSLMGGTIWLESEAGRGSTFHFTAAFGLAPEEERPRMEFPTPLRHREVLILDDNETQRRILEEMMAHWEMRPRTAATAEEMLEALDAAARAGQNFPLILLDIHLPDRDGFELAAIIRARQDLERPAIVVLAPAGRPGDATRCRQLGIAATLTKPVLPRELLESVWTALTARKADLAAPVPAAPDLPAVGLRILVAEDNPINQRLAVRLLEKKGHQVEVAANGQEALSALERGRFDLVLMDVQMPVLDGFQASAKIREMEKASGAARVPIVAMTAHALSGDRERCLAAGMDDYLAKPIDAAELYTMVERIALSATTGGAGPSEEQAATSA